MPNWCDTLIYFRGNRDDIIDFHDKLHKWTEEEGVVNGFGNAWLGNILYRAGMPECIARNCPSNHYYPHRGSVNYINDIEDTTDENDLAFSIDTYTAWAPMVGMFKAVIKHLGYDIDIAFQSEEPGCEVYITYDPEDWGFFQDMEVVVEWFFDDEETVFKQYPFLKDLTAERYYSAYEFDGWLDRHNMTIDQLNNLKFDDDDGYFRVYKFEYVSDYE